MENNDTPVKREKWETKTSKGLISTFIFAAILLFAGSYIYLRNEEKVWSNQALKQLKNTSVLKTRLIEAWRQERLADFREKAQSPLLQDAVYNWINRRGKNGLKDEIQQRLQIVIQDNPKFVNILLIDTKGQNLLSGKIGASDFSTASTGKLVREVIKTNKEIFGDWYKSSPEEAVYADIAYPLHGDRQEIVAIILFRIDPSIEMYPILKTGSDNSTEEAFLFEKAGDSVLYLTNLKSLPNAALSLKFPLTNNENPAVKAIKNGPGFYEGMGYHDQKVLEYIQPIKGTAWFLSTKIDKNELFQPVYQRIKIVVIIILLLFFSFSAVVLLILNFRRKHYYKQLFEDEKRLAALRKHYEYLVKYANDIILLEDDRLNIIEANERAQLTYQYGLEEFQKMKKTDLVAPEYRKASEERLKNLNKTEGYLIENVHQRKDGSRFDVEISARIIDIDGQKFLHQVIRDITERKNMISDLIVAKEHAQESERLKSAFLANISHEIRTPLNGILGFAEILKEPGFTGEEQKEYIEIIEQSGIRMLNTITDIVNLSEIEVGQMNLKLSELNVNKRLEKLYKFFKTEADKKGLKISYKSFLSDQDAMIQTDVDKFDSIFSNLIKNALKFTHQGEIEFGNVSAISNNSNHRNMKFYVKDTGIGIYPEQMQYIFERFRQGSESLNRKFEGTGLGLSISKAFAEVLGGNIWVESEPGNGSIFYFDFPLPMKSLEYKGMSYSESRSKNKGNQEVLKF